MLGQDVLRAGERAGHELDRRSTMPELDITDAAAVAACARARRARRGRQLRGLDRRRRRRDAPRAGARGQRRRAPATSRARPPQAGVPLLHVSTDYVFDGRCARATDGRAARLRGVRPARRPARSTAQSKLAGERQVLAASPRHTVVRTRVAVRHRRAQLRRRRCCGLARERERGAGRSSPTRSARPTWTGHLAPALLGLLERERRRARAPRRRGARARGTGSPCEIFRQAEVECEVEPATQRARWPARRPGPPGRRSSPSARTCCRCPRGRTGSAGYLAARAGMIRGMRLLVCGGAGFIGSTFARQRAARARRRGDGARQAHLRGPRGEPPRHRERAAASGSCAARSRTPRRSRGAIDGVRCRGDRQLRRRDPRGPLDRRARRVRAHPRARHLRAARGRPRARAALRAGVHRRGLRLDRARAPSPRRARCAPSSPYSATKAGADLLVQSYFHTYGLPTLICRGSNNYGPYQYPEKLIPLMILNALHGDPLPVYGDGMQVRNWIHAERLRAARSGTCSSTARRARSTTPAAPTRRPTSTVVRRIVELTGATESQIEHVARPARARPPLLAVLGEGPRARLGAAGALRRGARADRRLVSRERVVVGADPLRRLPRLLRAPVRALAALAGAKELTFQPPPSLTSVSRALRVFAVVDALDRRGGGLAVGRTLTTHVSFQVVDLGELVFERRFAAPARRRAAPRRRRQVVLADLRLVRRRRVGLQVGERLGDFVLRRL